MNQICLALHGTAKRSDLMLLGADVAALPVLFEESVPETGHWHVSADELPDSLMKAIWSAGAGFVAIYSDDDGAPVRVDYSPAGESGRIESLPYNGAEVILTPEEVACEVSKALAVEILMAIADGELTVIDDMARTH